MGARWSLGSVMDIPSARNLNVTYLRRRRLVQTPLFGVYVHHIFEPDDDRDPHDHPWAFGSFVLRGGYTEVVYPRPGESPEHYVRTRRRFSLHLMPLDKAHRIVRLTEGTVTLVIVGPKVREWGFWTRDGWVRWQDYNNAKYAGAQDEFA